MTSWFESNKTNNLLTPTKFDLRKYLYSFVVFLFSLFILNLFQSTHIFYCFQKSFDSFGFYLADKVRKGTCNFGSLIVKLILGTVH